MNLFVMWEREFLECIKDREWTFIQDTTDSKIFIQYAEFAMYQIKHTVKNQFGYFDMEAYRTSQEQYNEEKG